MVVDQPECGAGRASPAKWSNTNTGEKIEPNIRSLGCGLQFGSAENGLLAIALQNSIKHHFPPRRASNSRCLVQVTESKLSALFSLKTRCACHFILNEAVRNSALALH
jgi:hypothetical protein